MRTVVIGNKPLVWEDYIAIANGHATLELASEAAAKTAASRTYMEKHIAEASAPVYGINTGFGSLCNEQIADADLEQLQENLVLSHACGMGEKVATPVVRLMMALKVVSLAKGFSGVRLALVQALVKFYNSGATPVVFSQGSLGASGDLAPLAHLSLPLLGKGTVILNGTELNTQDAVDSLGAKAWPVMPLASKEGLALLNGTQFMSAHGIWALIQSRRIDYLADLIGTLSLEAHNGRVEPFIAGVHLTRPHQGQMTTATRVRKFLEGSPLEEAEKMAVQDPYSFRCMPQVHGASKDAIAHVMHTMLTEANAATDNPVVLSEEGKIVSAGNFHGQPLALTLDYLGIAVAEYANISERRTYQLISGRRGLPHFLTPNPGLNSGLMIAQYTAASMVSQNKQLASPASVDSIESSNGQEDHVSMGANAATKALRIIDNTYRVLAIELINASQALALRGTQPSPQLQEWLEAFRSKVAIIEDDRYLRPELAAADAFVRSVKIDQSEML